MPVAPQRAAVRGLRRIVPRPVKSAIRRATGRPAPTPTQRRLGPGDPGGIRRIHVGCGPQNLMAEWWNVDIRPFRGVDEVADVTVPWPWNELDYVYGEHFLEHLALEDSVRFLTEAATHLRPGGRIRLSTPGLEWVWQTHFTAGGPAEGVVADTYMANRAFHGWGHQFLYSRPFLERVLAATGFVGIEFFAFGESDDPELRGLERHGTPVEAGGWPSVWNVEAVRPDTAEPTTDAAFLAEIEQEFVRYVRSGH